MISARLMLPLLIGGLGVSPAMAASKATAYLIKQEIAEGCESHQGSINSAGVIERDLDGDGLPDLIISHDAIRCAGRSTRSMACGAQVCSVSFYMRRGQLLQKVHDMLGSDVKVGDGRIPKINMNSHGGPRGFVRWNGKDFH